MIPLIDIQRQHQSLREELEKEIRDVLERGQFILGKASEALEKRWLPFVAPNMGSE